MIMRTPKIAATGIILMTAAFAFTACGATADGGNSSSASAPQTSSAVPSTGGYTTAVKNQWVSQCAAGVVAAGGTQANATAQCECTMRAFEKTIPYDDFVAGNSGATGAKAKELETKASAITAACAKDPKAY